MSRVSKLSKRYQAENAARRRRRARRFPRVRWATLLDWARHPAPTQRSEVLGLLEAHNPILVGFDYGSPVGDRAVVAVRRLADYDRADALAYAMTGPVVVDMSTVLTALEAERRLNEEMQRAGEVLERDFFEPLRRRYLYPAVERAIAATEERVRAAYLADLRRGAEQLVDEGKPKPD